MASVSPRLDDDEYAQLQEDALIAGMNVTSFAKHLIMNRGKVKVKGKANDAAVIARLEAEKAEMQRQIDSLQGDRTRNETLAGLGALSPQKSIQEMVTEGIANHEKERRLADFEELKKKYAAIELEHTSLQKRNTLMSQLQAFGPALGQVVGTIAAKAAPELVRELAPMVATLSGLPGLEPSQQQTENLSDEDEQILEFGRIIFNQLNPKQSQSLVSIVETVAQLPDLIPYLEHTTQEVLVKMGLQPVADEAATPAPPLV